MDETSESVAVPLGTVYTAEKSDGENWIYLQDADGEYSGWLRVLKEDGLSYRVETGDEIYQLDNVFSYAGDGSDFSDPTKAAKLSLTGMFEDDLAGQSFVTLSFEEGELDEFLETHESDMDASLVETLKEREQAAQEYLSEGWSYMIYLYMYDGSAGDLRYIYDDYSNTLSVLKYTDLKDSDIEQGNYYQVGYATYLYEGDVDIERVVFVDYDDLGVNETEKNNGTQDEISRLSDAELDEKIEEILNLMYPER